jgi:GAF domain-containing protein
MDMLVGFTSALSAAAGPGSPLATPELLPSRLALAAQKTLPAEGVGLSAADRLRIPLGSSHDAAALAERIQVTLGEGPCLEAMSAGRPVALTESDMTARWPTFSHIVREQAGFRSVASVPLAVDGRRFGALDAYFTDPEGALRLDLNAAAELCGHIALLLIHTPPSTLLPGIAGPGWLASDSARERMTVWQAVGLIATAQGSSTTDALALLRSVAYSRSTDLDALSEDIISRRVAADSVLNG